MIMDNERLNPAIVNKLHFYLENSDLDVTTEKHIRLRLESDFGIDLSERKKALRQEIQNYLNSRQHEEDDEPEPAPAPAKKEKPKKEKQPKKERKQKKRAAEEPAEGEEKKKRGGGGLMKLCSLSPELASFLGVAELPRTEVVQGIWKYIKDHGLQDPANKRVIICDEALETLLGAPSTDMFQLNKLLKPHIHTIPGPGPVKPPKEEGAPTVSGLSRPLPLSAALSSFLNTGEAALPRSEVVKRFWAYIKEHNLQDPNQKKVIICDAPMRNLLGVDYIEGFGSITKLLSPHFGKASDSQGLVSSPAHLEEPAEDGHDDYSGEEHHGADGDHYAEGDGGDYE